MKLEFTQEALKDLETLDKTMLTFFEQHFEKILVMPPRKEMKYGIPFHKEEVTKQARIIYDITGETITIIRCFSTHKEYEKWYKTYR